VAVLRLIDIETKRHHFTLVLSPQGPDGRYVARYWNTPKAMTASYSRIEQQISGSVLRDNEDIALYLAFAEIEKVDGPILAAEENTYAGDKASLLPWFHGQAFPRP
jgi:hypothetical protein